MDAREIVLGEKYLAHFKKSKDSIGYVVVVRVLNPTDGKKGWWDVEVVESRHTQVPILTRGSCPSRSILKIANRL